MINKEAVIHSIKGLSENRNVRRAGKIGLAVAGPVLTIASIAHFSNPEPVYGAEPSPTVVREATPTIVVHTPTKVLPTTTREATPTVVAHTPTVVIETPTITPTPRFETPTITPTVRIPGQKLICDNYRFIWVPEDYVDNPYDNSTCQPVYPTATPIPGQRLICENGRYFFVNQYDSRFGDFNCVLPTNTSIPFPTSTPERPKPPIEIYQIVTGFKDGESMKAIDEIVHPQLAKENMVAGVDVLRDSRPIFSADVVEARPVVANIEWNGRVVRSNIETYAITEELDKVSQIDIGDPDITVLSAHSSKFNGGTPAGARFDEFKEGDISSLFVNGKPVSYEIAHVGLVVDYKKAIAEQQGKGKVVVWITCPEGVDPSTSDQRLVAIGYSKSESTIDIPVIGEISTETVVKGGIALGALGVLAGAGAYSLLLERSRRKQKLSSRQLSY